MIINVTVLGPEGMILPKITVRHSKACCSQKAQYQSLPGGVHRLQIPGTAQAHDIIVETTGKLFLAGRQVQAPSDEPPADAIVNEQIELGANRVMIINLNIFGADEEIIPNLEVKHPQECCDRIPIIQGLGSSRQIIFFGDPLPNETHTLVVEAEGYFTDSRFIARVAEQAVYNVDMALAPRDIMVIKANISGAEGEDIPGVQLKHWNGCNCGQTPLPQGILLRQLRFLGEQQPHRVVVEADGYYTANQEVVPVPQQNVYYVDFRLQARDLMLIRVNVTGPDGNPVPTAKIKHGGTCDCDQVPKTYGGNIGGPYILKFLGGRRTHIIVVEADGYFTANQEVVPAAQQYIYNLQFGLRPREDIPGPPLPPQEQPALPCGFPTITDGKPCKRKTRQEHCFQHMDKDDPAMKKYAGTWTMNGFQIHVPHSGWEARLILRANGTLTWKETKGANVGAERNGRWTLENTALVMRYPAPVVGLVQWTSSNPNPSQMGGIYRTPEIDPQGVGWGGEWSAYKVVSD